MQRQRLACKWNTLKVALIVTVLIFIHGCSNTEKSSDPNNGNTVTPGTTTTGGNNTGGTNTGTGTTTGSGTTGTTLPSVSGISPSNYVWADLNEGTSIFIDRSYTYSNIPSTYVGAKVLQTANDDKTNADAEFLSFTVSENSTVYVAYDLRNGLPDWLSSWNDTGDNIGGTDATRRIFEKDFSAGTVVLPGNFGVPSASMFTVIMSATTTGTGGNGTQVSDTAPILASTVSAPSLTVGTPITWNLANNVSGTQTISYTDNGNSLPEGLAISAAGMISGTPTLAGTYSVNITAENSFGTLSIQFQVNVQEVTVSDQPPTITSGSMTFETGCTNSSLLLSVHDPDSSNLTVTITEIPSLGTVVLGGAPVTVGQTFVGTDLSNLTYNCPSSGTGSAGVLGFSVSDGVNPSQVASAGIIITAVGLTSALDSLAASMQPGQLLELTTNEYNVGDAFRLNNNTNTGLQWTQKMAYDPVRRQILLLTKPHNGNLEFPFFDIPSNTWATVSKPLPGGGIFLHPYDHHAVDPSDGMLYVREAAREVVHIFDNGNAQTWGKIALIGDSTTQVANTLEFFPNFKGIDANGQDSLIFYNGRNGNESVRVWTKATNTWAKLPNTSVLNDDPGTYHTISIFNSKADNGKGIMLFGGGNSSRRLYMLYQDGTLKRTVDAPAAARVQNTEASSVLWADPNSRMFLLFDNANGNLWQFDPVSEVYQQVSPNPFNGSPFQGTLGFKHVGVVNIPDAGVTLIAHKNSGIYLYKHKVQ